jgi:adenylate kinase
MQQDIILLGVQGCGKGTQADVLSKEYNYDIITLGQVLRDRSGDDTKEGKIIAESINNGHLLPSDMANTVFLQTFQEKKKSSLIIDGYPRKLHQAEFLFDLYKKENRSFCVVYIMLSEDEVYRRLEERYQREHRADDSNKAKVEHRIEQFYSKTLPLVDIFEKDGLLIRIDGEQSVEKVTEEIEVALEQKSFQEMSS